VGGGGGGGGEGVGQGGMVYHHNKHGYILEGTLAKYRLVASKSKDPLPFGYQRVYWRHV